MLPLYKRTDNGWLYWQGWHHLNYVSVITGRVGERATVTNHRAPDEPTAIAEVQAATALTRAVGYAEIPTTEYHQVVVQWARETWASVRTWNGETR